MVIIQNCTTTENVATDQKTITDEEIYKDVETIKTMLGYASENESNSESVTAEQPLDFGISLSAVQKQFPAPDKSEYEPMVNNKVTLLTRGVGGGRFTFFFYENKLYKIVILSSWSDYTLQFAENDIKKTETIFIEGNGEPDFVEEDKSHKKMVWLKEDLEVTLEEFHLMSHRGVNRVMSLMYTDRNISQYAKKDESFELYKTKREGVQDH